MIKVTHRGSFRKTERFFANVGKTDNEGILEQYAKAGVRALASATPKDTGETASKWSYEIAKSQNGYEVHWTNSNVNQGVNIALILQYGHGTANGCYVEGTDYINPALKTVFEQYADAIWEEVRT